MSLLFKLFILIASVGAVSSVWATPSKVIDFEGDVVEGLNKRPLDSFSQVSERKERGSRAHLYRKRKGFDSETKSLLIDLKEGGESE